MTKHGWTNRGASKCVSAALCAGLSTACSPTPDTLDSGDPAGRIHAAGEAAASGDMAALPDLVAMLSSDDPAERMVAIGTLQRLTDRRFGYDPTASSAARFAAIQRWEGWLAARTQGEAGGTGGGPLDPATVTPRTPRTDR